MNPLDRIFGGRKALIFYLMAGDPDRDATVALARTLEEAGADALELGMPFSDPQADGPVIQAAANRALRGGPPWAGPWRRRLRCGRPPPFPCSSWAT